MSYSSSCFGTAFRPWEHPTTCVLLAAVIVITLLAAVGARHSLCLIWNHTFMTQFYFWNVLTASFVETSIFKLAFALVGMVGMGPAAEESLGHVGLAVFLLVVGLAAGLITSTGIFVAYIVTREEYLLDLELHGSFGLLAGLAVAAVQQSPEGSLLPDGFGPRFPKRYFPLLLLTVSAVGRTLSVPVISDDFPFVCVGGYAAWVYLRFFAHIVLGGPSGDVNSEFELVMFFPSGLRRVIKPLCDFTYGVFLLLGFFKGRAARVPLPVVDGEGGVDPSTAAILPLPERKDPIAERRRARAMKLLDEKFAKLNAKPVGRWDDDEDWEGVHGAGAEAKPAAVGLAVPKSTKTISQAERGSSARLSHSGDDDDWGMAAGADDDGEAKPDDAVRSSLVQCERSLAVRCGARTMHPMDFGAMRCGATRCGAVRCGPVRRGTAPCSALQCGSVECGATLFDVIEGGGLEVSGGACSWEWGWGTQRTSVVVRRCFSLASLGVA
eukprot:jgi/Undpi1/8056/HiC_scaffold_24.g10528.m1